MDDLASPAAPAHDSAAETARVSFCCFYAEELLEVGFGGLGSFVASKSDNGWLLISDPRLVLTDRQTKNVAFLVSVHSNHL